MTLKKKERKGLRDFGSHALFLLLESAIHIINNLAEKKVGPLKERVGVFGPYSDKEKRKTVLDTARVISNMCYPVLTGMGFFPAHSKRFVKIIGIMPELVQEIRKAVKSFRFYFHFPKLVGKGVFYLTDLRGQGDEAMGCHTFHKPMFGFILTKKLTGKNYCPYLYIESNYSECKTPDSDYCVGETFSKSFFCPFHDAVNVPWVVKELFFNSKNRLVAARDLKDLEPLLREFLKK